MQIEIHRESTLVENWTQRLLFTVVFLFPVLAGVLEHMASSLLIVSGLLGLGLIRRPLLKFSRWEWVVISGLVIFVLVAAISLINAVDPGYGLRRLENLAKLLLFPIVLLGWRYLPTSPLLPFSYGLLFAGPVYLSVALVQVYGDGLHRAVGAYNPIVFGQLAILIMALLGSLLIHGVIKQRLFRILALPSMVCALAAGILSGSRGAWLLLPVLGVVWFITSGYKGKKIMIFLGGSLLLFLSLGGMDLFGSKVFRERMIDAVSDVSSLTRGNIDEVLEDPRYPMWQAAVEIWQEKPFLGAGLGGFPHQLKIMIAEGRTSLRYTWTHAHSIYFEFLATTGLVGFITMIAAVFVIPGAYFCQRLRETPSLETRAAALTALVALVAFAVFGLTESWLSRSPLLSTYLFCLLLFFVSLAPSRDLDPCQK